MTSVFMASLIAQCEFIQDSDIGTDYLTVSRHLLADETGALVLIRKIIKGHM